MKSFEMKNWWKIKMLNELKSTTPVKYNDDLTY